MKRREFLSAAAAGAATLATGAFPRALSAATAPRKPNFIFVYTDDQRWDAMSVVQREQGAQARFPWLKTPNMDRVAAEGVRFRNAFVVNSLCAPSRANFLTSRYSHMNGVANNHTPYPLDSVSHASVLSKAGYKTGYFGKFHMGGQTGQRPGFDYSASFIGQGQYIDCPFEINGKPTPTTGYVDDVSTNYALEFMKENKDRPFSVVLGLKAVHGPRTPPEKYKTLYAGESGKPPVNAAPLAPYLADRPMNAGPTEKWGTDNFLNYFRTLQGADDNLGRLLQALDDLKLADDTAVIFCSDNGYFFGEHGLGDKRAAYDESLRIPLVMRYPKMVKPGSLNDAMVLNIDLAPTLLDLAGVPIPESMQGKSWKPLLAGTAASIRDAYFYEYFFERGFATPTNLAVRTMDAKLIKYPGHDEWTELYDLKADPLEMKNLARDPAAKDLLARMQAEFDRQAAAVGFKIPDYADKPGEAPPAGKAKKAGKGGKKKGKKKAAE